MNNPTKEQVSALVPNTFPFPNFIMDENEHLKGYSIWAMLDGAQQNILACVYRKTFGWWKRSDHISLSQLQHMSGLSEATIRAKMDDLISFGLVMRLSENNGDKRGTEWEVQTDDAAVQYSALLAAWQARHSVAVTRIIKARAALPPLSDKTGSVPQGRKALPPLSHSTATPAVPQNPQNHKKPIKESTRAPKITPSKTKAYPQDEYTRAFKGQYLTLATWFVDATGIYPFLAQHFVLWNKALAEWIAGGLSIDDLDEALAQSRKPEKQGGFSVNHPGALTKTAIGFHGARLLAEKNAEKADSTGAVGAKATFINTGHGVIRVAG